MKKSRGLRLNKSFNHLVVLLILTLLTAACGGGGGGGSTDNGGSEGDDSTTYAISGAVSGDVTAGVTVSLSGDESMVTTTDASGNYSFTGLPNGSYTATPSLAGHIFNPVSQAVTLNGADSTGNDFVSTFTVSSISGTVAGTRIIAVNDSGDIVASDDTAGKTPDGSGNYPFTLTGISVGVNIRVYLITGSGVFPLYFGSPSTNVFSLSAITTINLGFVNTTGGSGQAISANDPLAVTGVKAGIVNTVTPPNVSLIGTWGFGRLKHRNSDTWAAKSGKFIYSADGTGSTDWQESDNGILSSGSSTWTWTAVINLDGTITLTRTFPDTSIKMRRIVISDDGMVMILDGTDMLDKQRFRVAVRMNTTQTYTNADLSGNYYLNGYAAVWDTGLFYNEAGAGTLTSNTAGNFTMTTISNRNGSIGGPGTYTENFTINADGSIPTGSAE